MTDDLKRDLENVVTCGCDEDRAAATSRKALARIEALEAENADLRKQEIVTADMRAAAIARAKAAEQREAQRTAALNALVALHDKFMKKQGGFMGNQADAYDLIATRFDIWTEARTALATDAGEDSHDR